MGFFLPSMLLCQSGVFHCVNFFFFKISDNWCGLWGVYKNLFFFCRMLPDWYCIEQPHFSSSWGPHWHSPLCLFYVRHHSIAGKGVRWSSQAMLDTSKDTHHGLSPLPSPSSQDLTESNRSIWLPLLLVLPVLVGRRERRTELKPGTVLDQYGTQV